MSWKETPKRTSMIADPYFHWAQATDYAYYFQGEARTIFPVILELKSSAVEFAARVKEERANGRHWVVPPIYESEAGGLEDSRYCTARVDETFFAELDRSLEDFVERAGIGLPAETTASGGGGYLAEARAAEPGAVVTGVIDDALAFAHARFRKDGWGTRIEFLWNQDGTDGAVPGFGYGSEITKREIDRYLRATADEEAIYRLAGHLDFSRPGRMPLAWRRSHGTHVMDLAAGYDPGDAPNNRPIIGVQLPVATTADTSGRSLGVQVLDGVRYILQRADSLSGRHQPALPVVVNLSYGLMAGAHDGTSILERALDDLIERRKRAPLEIVLPAGNNRQSRCHARFRVQGKHILHWRIPPDDTTPSFVEIWAPETARADGLSVRVRPPGAAWSPPVGYRGSQVWQPEAHVLAQAVYLPGGGRDVVLVAVAPTAAHHAERKVAPAGLWEISVELDRGTAEIEAWIQRDDTPYGYARRGRQSRFVDGKYPYRESSGRLCDVDRAGSYVKRDGAFNAIATGARTTAIGGYLKASPRKAALHSGRMPASSRRRDLPDALAVSDESVVCRGVLAAGSRSGSCVAMSGTSVAAAQASRLLVEKIGAWAQGRRGASPSLKGQGFLRPTPGRKVARR